MFNYPGECSTTLGDLFNYPRECSTTLGDLFNYPRGNVQLPSGICLTTLGKVQLPSGICLTTLGKVQLPSGIRLTTLGGMFNYLEQIKKRLESQYMFLGDVIFQKNGPPEAALLLLSQARVKGPTALSRSSRN